MNETVLGAAEPIATSARPPLCEEGLVVVVTESFPPRPGGSSTVMRNLLLGYDPESFLVVTAENTRSSDQKVDNRFNIHHVLHSNRDLPSRINRVWRNWQLKRLGKRLAEVVKRTRPVAILGVYPDFHFLKATREAARATGAPWVLYAHDTIAESLQHTALADEAASLQKAVLEEASEILVMSDGMAALFERKYGVDAQPLEHIYSGSSHELPDGDSPRSVFWGGQIYNINKTAVSRVSNAAVLAECTLTVTTSQSENQLASAGLAGNHLAKTFYPDLRDYLAALRSHGVLVLALDSPHESPVHKDELSTIFPTKTPEYLASGRPILVHCPEDYFLARFFRRWNCGLVVSDRSAEALARGIRRLLTHHDVASAYTRAARDALQVFSADRVRHTLSEALSSAADRGLKMRGSTASRSA